MKKEVKDTLSDLVILQAGELENLDPNDKGYEAITEAINEILKNVNEDDKNKNELILGIVDRVVKVFGCSATAIGIISVLRWVIEEEVSGCLTTAIGRTLPAKAVSILTGLISKW